MNDDPSQHPMDCSCGACWYDGPKATAELLPADNPERHLDTCKCAPCLAARYPGNVVPLRRSDETTGGGDEPPATPRAQVIEVLKQVLADVEAGTYNPDAILLIMRDIHPDQKQVRYPVCVANLTGLEIRGLCAEVMVMPQW